jgi:hypothetical protein
MKRGSIYRVKIVLEEEQFEIDCNFIAMRSVKNGLLKGKAFFAGGDAIQYLINPNKVKSMSIQRIEKD